MSIDTILKAPEKYPQYMASVHIWKYIPPIQIIIGTSSNILSAIVLSRKAMSKSTTLFYFRILAVSDILALCTGLLRYWIYYAFQIDIRTFSDFGCRLHLFLVYFSLHFSTWVLVAVTIDRCLTVCATQFSKSFCTLKRAKIIVLTIFVLMAALNCHFFATTSLNGSQKCDSKSQHKGWILDVWPLVDLLVYCVGPLIIMFVCTTFIIKHIRVSSKRISNYRQSTRGAHPALEMLSSRESSLQRENRLPDRREKRISHVTTMLLSVNTVYFICTLPITVYLISYKSWVPDAPPAQYAIAELVWSICYVLQYMNNTLDFFMYCLTYPKFRKELLCVFHIKKQR